LKHRTTTFRVCILFVFATAFIVTDASSQLYKTGWASAHILTQSPSSRLILGQVFAGRTNGFLPLQPELINSVQNDDQDASLPSMRAWPNPANELVSFSLAASNVDRTYSLYNSSGVRVANGAVPQAATSLWLDVHELPAGVYSMVVYGGSKLSSVITSIVR
jgi:hypothetical protein